jgi:small-conductance mechanosensitive channel
MGKGIMKKRIHAFFCLIFLLTVAIPLWSEAQPPPKLTVPTAAKPEGVPLILGDTTILSIRNGLEGGSAQSRAGDISGKLQEIAENSAIPNKVTSKNFQGPLTEILVGDKLLMVILDQDARLENRSREALGQEYAEKIQTAIAEYRRQYLLKEILFDIFYTLLATVVLALALVLINRLYRKINEKLQTWMTEGKIFLRLQEVEFIRLERIRSLERGILSMARAALFLTLFYIYAHLVLGFFPWTKPFAGKISFYVLQPFRIIADAVWDQVPNLLFVAALGVVSCYVLKLVRLFFLEVEKGTIALKGFFPEWARPTYKIVRLIILAFAIVVAFPYIPGSNSLAFKGISVFIGVLFSIGSTSAISNIIAGYIITYRRVFKVGDRIKIADFMGDVTQMRLQVTHLKTIKNEEIIVPNSLIVNSHVINYSTMAEQEGLILYTSVTIGYDAPWRQVHELLIKAALATEGILKEPPPFVLQRGLSDFYVNYELNAYTRDPQKMVRLYSGLHQNIQDQFNEGGVEIMSPHYTQVRDGNQTTIPEAYLPPDYAPRAFRVVPFSGQGGSFQNSKDK